MTGLSVLSFQLVIAFILLIFAVNCGTEVHAFSLRERSSVQATVPLAVYAEDVRAVITFGGWLGSSYWDMLELFDVDAQSWHPLTPASGLERPSARGYLNGAWYQGNLIVSGGYDGEYSVMLSRYQSCNTRLSTHPLRLSSAGRSLGLPFEHSNMEESHE